MDLKAYFESTKGYGVLATADADGRVNGAVYSRPHVMEDETLAFIMWDRLTHQNLQKNPYAHFTYREDAKGYKGLRLYLKKTREEEESERLYELRRKSDDPDKHPGESKFLVFFKVEKTLPLVGTQPVS